MKKQTTEDKVQKEKKQSKEKLAETKKQANKNKDEKKKLTSKKQPKKEKKNIFKRLIGFLGDVKKEMKKVHWPSKKDMVKYSIATLCFIVFFSLFFYLIDIIFAFIKSLV